MEQNFTNQKIRAERNRTLTLRQDEIPELKNQILTIEKINSSGIDFSDKVQLENLVTDKIINCDIFEGLKFIPDEFADLIIIDPPYNLTKNFNGVTFSATSESNYDRYLESWFFLVCKKLKKNGSLYMCGDWKCTSSLQRVIEKELTILNRITWQREKGRGARQNWKNSMEDIWFAVKNPDDYYFNVEDVKLKRRVLAPYRQNGIPKDWDESDDGKFRLTYPSNFWDDISVPFWSMPENTDHPTQKPEKLYAKLILASCREHGTVFDPFVGSGTASVTAKKLNRHFCGIELNEEYSLLAQKRLNLADIDKSIQGYRDGVFYERNSFQQRHQRGK
ncbi:MAG: DNA-methyltransferase [Treponema sp.]